MADAGYEGYAKQNTQGDFNEMSFLIEQMINRTATVTIVKVVAVHGGGIAEVGTVDVLPLVSQMDGKGQAVPHTTVHGLPYFRIQGGVSAVILDPKVGDIGMAAFCSHDISAVKATKDAALPGSHRRFDWADGLYIGGFLNGTPTQYIFFDAGGVTVKAPTVTIDATTTTHTGDLVVQGASTFTGDVAMVKLTTTDDTSLGGGSQFVKRADGSNSTKVKVT